MTVIVECRDCGRLHSKRRSCPSCEDGEPNLSVSPNLTGDDPCTAVKCNSNRYFAENPPTAETNVHE